jgi:hypothetical protein
MRAIGFAAAAFLIVRAAVAAEAPVDIKKEVLTACGSIPMGPTLVIDPKTATKEDMLRTRDLVADFIKKSDSYQACLMRLAEKLKDRITDTDKLIIAGAIERSQQEKEALGNDYNNLADAYNARS